LSAGIVSTSADFVASKQFPTDFCGRLSDVTIVGAESLLL